MTPGSACSSTLPAWMTTAGGSAGAADAGPAPAAATVASKRAAPETFADAEEPSQAQDADADEVHEGAAATDEVRFAQLLRLAR